MEKKPILSTNFWVSVISIITAGLTLGSGVPIDVAPEAILTALATKQGVALIVFFTVNLINPLLRIIGKIRAGLWNWDWLRSTNFLTQIGSLLTIILSSWFDAETTGVIIAMLGQLANWLYHLFLKKKE